MKKLIKKVRSKLLGYQVLRIIDSIIRILFSKLILISKISESKNKIILLYGGLGDCISWLIFNYRVYDNENIVFAIPSKYRKIIQLLSTNKEIIYYDSFFSLIFNLRKNFYNYIFIYTSPIFELRIIQFLSGMKNGGGYVKNYKTIHSTDNLIKYLDQSVYSNFYKRRNILLQEVLKRPINIVSIDNNLKSIFSNHKINIVMNLEKSQNWLFKEISSDEIEKIIELLFNKFKNIEIYMVGLKRRDDLNYLKHKYRNFNNMMGITSEFELVELIQNSQLVISLESGIAHLAYFFQKPIIIIQTYTDAVNFSLPHVNIVNNNAICSPCVVLEAYPKDIYPPICKNNYKCQNNLLNNLLSQLDKLL